MVTLPQKRILMASFENNPTKRILDHHELAVMTWIRRSLGDLLETDRNPASALAHPLSK